METNLSTHSRNHYGIILLLVFVCLMAFGRTAGNDFINFDDNKYVTENKNIQSGFNLKSIPWAVKAVVVSNWHPLTLFSHMLDWKLFGSSATGHHIVSLLLHLGTVVFLFLFLNKTTRNIRASAFAVALFAIHPLRVESVAWIAERKDVLSMFWGMACLYAYAYYTELPRLSRYLVCLTLFALALMSKAMMITLPFVMMLLDYWPLQRWQKSWIEQRTFGIFLEKIPFILLTIFSGMVTFLTHSQGSSVTAEVHPTFLTRCANAAVSCATYLAKTFWPVNLAAYYPYNFQLPLWKVSVSLMIILLITVMVLYYIRKRPFLFVGWFWYMGTIIPVIGLVPFGTQAMADRYTYLPSVGIAIILSWGFPLLLPWNKIRRRLLYPFGIVIIILLSVLTWQQCGYWKNSITLFNRTLQITTRNHIAHNHLALALFKKRSFEDALDHYNKAIDIHHGYTNAYYNRGIVYYMLGQKLLALDDFKQASNLIPKTTEYASVFNNMGVIYTNLQQYQPAIDNYNKAISLDQNYADAYNNRAYAYIKNNNTLSGCHDAEKACALGNCRTLDLARDKGVCH